MKAMCVHCSSVKSVEPKNDKRKIAVVCMKCYNKRRGKMFRVRKEEERLLNEAGYNV